MICKNKIEFNSATFSRLNFLSNEGFKCVSSNTVLLHSSEDSEDSEATGPTAVEIASSLCSS